MMAERRVGGHAVAIEEAHDLIFEQYSDDGKVKLDSSSDGLL